MLSNMANSLLLHKRITTTLAKAKELRVFVEPMITRAKEDTTHNRREVFSTLKSKQVVTELFRDIIVKIGERPGGYTRILKTGNRLGDNAEMCIIELVDYNENMLSTPKAEPAKKRRTRKTKKIETPAKEVKKSETASVEAGS
jgi:large subunit ribosomal protein L17